MNQTINSIIILLLLAVILHMAMCHGSNGRDYPPVKTDTVWLPVKADTQYIPVPYLVKLPGREVEKEVPVPVYITPDPQVVDTQAIVRNYFPIQQDYFSTRYYADTFAVQHGKAYRYDTVSRNRLVGTGMRLDQKIPQITRTEQVKRTQLYIGGSFLGDIPMLSRRGQLVTGSEISLMLKTKTDLCIEAAFQKPWDAPPQHRVGFKVPLRFKRQ